MQKYASRQPTPNARDDIYVVGFPWGGAALTRIHQAGGFALEDPDLSTLVEKIEGSVDSIFGLPVGLLCTLIERAAV